MATGLALGPCLARAEGRPAMPLVAGLGAAHLPIATASPTAQAYFDQGLALLYGFNHAAAIASFEAASAADPAAPMPWWGIALALGPNVNKPIDREGEKAAWAALRRAVAHAAGAPAQERAYLDALRQRYGDGPEPDRPARDAAYSRAMRDLAARYPDDLNAATLYAESLLDLHPWSWWSAQGEPRPETAEAVSVLKGVLRRDPDHLGANHLVIHALEQSPEPWRALPSAQRLERLAPAAGHLTHMPSHIYMRTGDYDRTVGLNAAGVAADRAFFAATGLTGTYSLDYTGHNLLFENAAAMLAGRHEAARTAAEELGRNAREHAAAMPAMAVGMQGTAASLALLTAVRFGDWERVLALPPPEGDDVGLRALGHFARGVAFAARGHTGEAERERDLLTATITADGKPPPATGTLAVARQFLDARLAEAAGDRTAAIARWREAVAVEDRLSYGEPPPWFYPTREGLGGALLRRGAEGDAVEAEAVFRDGLRRHQRSGRALFGLWQSLAAQGRAFEAGLVRERFDSAWARADVTLSVAGL